MVRAWCRNISIALLLFAAPLSSFAQTSAPPIGESRLGPWKVQAFKTSQLESTPDRTVKISANSSGGMFFRADADAAERYQLAVSGKPLSGAASLRITFDNKPPQYFAAPTGKFALTVDGAHTVEVLIYADNPFSYRVDNIALTPCPTCTTPAERVAMVNELAAGARVELYQEPSITKGQEENQTYLAIGSAGALAGVYFDYDLSPDRSYRVEILGHPADGSVNLRLDKDQRPPEWANAPDGDKSILVTDTTKLRVLLYGDQAYEYRLSKINVTEDPKTFTTGEVGPWKVQAFKTSRLVSKPDHAIEVSAESSGGIFFRQDADAAEREQLVVSGQPLTGAASLRVTFDHKPPQYFAAPTGELTLPVVGVHTVEVLLYADSPFSYHVDNIALTPCATCISPAERVAAVNDFAPGARVAPYREPSISKGQAENQTYVAIGSADGAAGVYFDYDLSPDRGYRVNISGHPAGGNTKLRLDKDQQPPEWFNPPDGDKSILVTDTTKLRVLLYADKPYEYRLIRLTVVEDPKAVSGEKLKQIILGRRPKLAAMLAQGQTPDAIKEILEWTSGIASLGYRTDIVARNTAEVAEKPVEQSYQDVWKADAGGASCGAFAVFFAKVLNLFGFDAMTIDVGYPGTFITHVTTIVPLGSATNGTRLYLFDPTFTAVYEDPATNKMLDLAEVLKRDAEGLHTYRFTETTIP
ncbi:MAG TPA: hypothetical protein VG308_13820, partial [Stellaceae bacterium]|nr:hypothetical protein [Stellaceae bacterium]